MEEKLKFAFYTLIVIIFQSIIKIIGVLLTGSLSFLSESIDTLTDFIFVSITIYAIKQSTKERDLEHMYGHGKIDSIGAMMEGIILILLYIFLLYTAIQTLIKGQYVINNAGTGLQILIISFSVNIIFSRYLIWQGKRRKSHTLKIQGLNLFQDSMRAILVMISFVFALNGIFYTDIFFSIALQIWIIVGAVSLTREGIKDVTDTNPINSLVLEEIRQNIFNLDHVNAIEDLKVRASGNSLFLEVQLLVEDHISLVHADGIIKAIRSMGKHFFPNYEVQTIVEMNPLSGEATLGETIINLINSIKLEYTEIYNVKDVNIFKIEKKYFLSLTIIVDDSLSLQKAHDICTDFEKELKEHAPEISRIITHIEAHSEKKGPLTKQMKCEDTKSEEHKKYEKIIENLLSNSKEVKGFHGFELWKGDECNIIEVHVFFDGALNIAQVHSLITTLEQQIREQLKYEIPNLSEVILHSEPLKGRTDGITFNNIK